MKITVVIDKQTCIGSQTCIVEDEEHFSLDDNDRALVRKDKDSPWTRKVEMEVTEERKEQLLMIAKLCPTRAIRILDENKNQLFPKSV